MSRLRILFLSALAKTTCFDLLDGEPPRRLSEASAFVAAIEALKGIAYSAIACLLFWLLRSQAVAGIIATAAICILHSRIANKSRPPSPARLRMLFFPKLDDSPYFEPLAVLLLPGLTLFLLLMGGALWLPTILAVSAAAALEISGTRNDSGDKERLSRSPGLSRHPPPCSSPRCRQSASASPSGKSHSASCFSSRPQSSRRLSWHGSPTLAAT